MRPLTFFLVTIGLFAVVAAAAAIAGGISWVVPVLLVALVAAAWAVANHLLARQTLDRHGGDAARTQRDASEGGLPKTHVVGDERTPLGDTPEAHAELSPHDIPKGSPQRAAVERMAEEEPGGDATRGHADPSRRAGRVGHTSGARGG